jgi:hypothetical protein
VAPHVGRDREARGIDREEIAPIEVHRAMAAVVGERLERREPARLVNIVDDPEALDVPLAVRSPLEARGHEEHARVGEIDRERREQEPGKPVVPPGPLVGEEDIIANREPAVGPAHAPVQEGRAEDTGAQDGRADAYLLSLDLGLLRGRSSLVRRPRPRQIAAAREDHQRKEGNKDGDGSVSGKP